MPLDPGDLPDPVLEFLVERHLATLTTLRRTGRPHVVPVGFTFDPAAGVARVITSGPSVKARNLAANPWASLCQVDGRRWITLEGSGRVVDEPAAVRDAEARYERRYRTPRPNPRRVVLVLDVVRVLGGTWS